MCPGAGGARRQKSRNSAASELKNAIKAVQRMLERSRKDCALLEEILWLLFSLERVLENSPRPPHPPGNPPGPAPAVRDYRTQPAANGRVLVTFDNSKQVTLSRTLTEFLAALAADTGESPDDLVAWKSFDQLGEMLGKRLPREFDHHKISQLLWLLHQALKPLDRDMGLIESVPGLGARLRLKRRQAGMGGL